MRTVVRSTLIAGMTGALMVSVAWAGIGISPLPGASAPTEIGQVGLPGSTAVTGTQVQANGINPASLGAGELLVGAAKTSMNPQPDLMKTKGFPDARWETDPVACTPTEPDWYADLPKAALMATDGIANPGSTWPENPDCIYQGGFGLGPTNPVKAFDQTLGLWVRSMAISDGSKTIVMTVIDGEGWLWDYRSKCTDCGAKQIAAALAADPELSALGVTPASHILHATHSHASPDFIGGWGFVPNWYMKQISDSIKATAKQAVLSMEAATLETGEEEARAYNTERRDTYRAAEEAQISWLRAVAVDSTPPAQVAAEAAPAPTETGGPGDANGKGKKASPSPSPSPSPTETTEPVPPRVIATLGAYAAHPTSMGTNGGVAHPDWVGTFEQRLEERFGGIGLHFMTGLGNLSNSGGVTIGTKLANLIPEIGGGRVVDDTTVKVTQTLATSALTNVPLTALGTPGLFDRKFAPTPAVVNVGESETAPCTSASAQSVELPNTAARIGNDIVFTAAPGEVFANYTNTVKEKNVGRITFPLAQSNDALGYMPQSFEINPVGQQGLGFAAGGYLFVNYEDSYAIDRCTGDLMLEETLKNLDVVKAP
ncbi:MAG: hypothetical protein JJD92_07295 [Frankiaceae bacterium]|nr:hypothetical protein [Frankiaceae bacterium]